MSLSKILKFTSITETKLHLFPSDLLLTICQLLIDCSPTLKDILNLRSTNTCFYNAISSFPLLLNENKHVFSAKLDEQKLNQRLKFLLDETNWKFGHITFGRVANLRGEESLDLVTETQISDTGEWQIRFGHTSRQVSDLSQMIDSNQTHAQFFVKNDVKHFMERLIPISQLFSLVFINVEITDSAQIIFLTDSVRKIP